MMKTEKGRWNQVCISLWRLTIETSNFLLLLLLLLLIVFPLLCKHLPDILGISEWILFSYLTWHELLPSVKQVIQYVSKQMLYVNQMHYCIFKIPHTCFFKTSEPNQRTDVFACRKGAQWQEWTFNNPPHLFSAKTHNVIYLSWRLRSCSDICRSRGLFPYNDFFWAGQFTQS